MGGAAEGQDRDLPREKLARAGAAALSDAELLALVLGHGVAGRSALTIATALLRELGGVHGLTRVTPGRLAMTSGIGGVQSARVIAAIELGRRTLFVSPQAKLPLRTPTAVAEFLLPRFGAHPVERFGVVMLDSRHRLMRALVVSEGTLDSTMAVAREVFREATISGAAAVVLFHNHPSGDPTPSREDIALTSRLAEAGRTLGIDVVDHMILADASYCSLRQAQLI